MDNNSFTLGVGKAKNAKLTFKQFYASIKKYRFSILISIILAVASAVTGLFTPKILGDMTTIAFNTYPNIDFVTIGQKAIVVIVLFLISAALNYAQAFILGVVSARYTRDMREMIIDKISKLPISYFDRHKFGDTLSRMTNDIDVLTTSMSQEIADISLSITTLVGVMIIMLVISVPLSLISFIIVPLSVVVVGKIAKMLAFRVVRPTDRPQVITYAISICICCIMCPTMSLIAMLLFKDPKGFSVWIQTWAMNFPMAILYQMFYCGPLVRLIFRTIFREKA